jgi:predicted MFS family arabinose efflux permease
VFIPLGSWLIADFGWRHALWVLAGLQLLLCAPIHALVLRGAPGSRSARGKLADAASPGIARPGLGVYLRSAPFLLIGVFVVLMMGVSAALPPHMIALLREAQLPGAWVIAIPATIGLVQVLGRLLLYFFEQRFDLHLANRLIPWLMPLGVAALLAGQHSAGAALLFVLLYGLGNGMLTIVKGTAIAFYVNREHVASLNGALGFPTALARALGPLALGLLWSQQSGYRTGLWLLLAVSVLATLALAQAQRRSLIGLKD